MKEKKQTTPLDTPVAIIGMGCLFPQSAGLKAYWQLLVRGRDAITDIPATHWPIDAYFDLDPKKPDHVYCKRGAFLPSIAFDPSEYGIPPSSLEATDTSQLLALIIAKNALDDAGYGAGKSFDRDRASVILGVTGTQELVIPLGARLGHPIWRKAILEEGLSEETTENIVNRISNAYVPWQENSFPGLLGNVVAGRICNRLDFGGTNCVVDAACASSMSALHLSLLELQSHRSDMVIAGGVDTINDIFMHMCFSKTMILSKTGDIRPFSKDADGTVLGEGIGMVVLKRLADAEKDGDDIYAVIKAMGSSSDGKSQSIYAPRAEGQAKALRMAYQNAQIDPATVKLVEAHGTGTRVGDKVELEALKMVHGSGTENRQQTAIGSVKSMIGHTKAAAGTAGLIKAALALNNKVLPPTLKAEYPDPELGLKDSPFYINSKTRPWVSSEGHPRRAGVSSFGFGGSNFHLVMEEYRAEKKAVSWDGSVEIFAFSAQDRKGVAEQLLALKTAAHAIDPVQTINRLAADTRHRFSVKSPCRLLFVLETTGLQNSDVEKLYAIVDKAIAHLDDAETKSPFIKNPIFYAENHSPGKLAFVFPGQGSQYPGMGRDIACAFPEGMNALEKLNKFCPGDTPLTASIFPLFEADAGTRTKQAKALSRTDVAQPAIGGISLAMRNVLARFGLIPDATCGHSFGELTALYAAGWIDEDTFLKLSSTRGRVMAEAANAGPEGTMLAVKAPLKTIESLILDIPGVVLANLNGPEQGVLSGPVEGIVRAETMLKQNGYRSIRLPVSAAFHSSLIRDAQKPFDRVVQSSVLNPTDMPVFSNTSGGPYPKDVQKAKTLLSEQMLKPVHFVTTIENLYAAGIRTFVEVGPKAVLTGLVKTILAGKTIHPVAMDASAGKRYGIVDLAVTLAQLAALGYPVSLDTWEDRIPEPKKQRMTIMLNGANYRDPKKPLPIGTQSPHPATEQRKKRTPKIAPKQGSLSQRQQPNDLPAGEPPVNITSNTTENAKPDNAMKKTDDTENHNSRPSPFVENALQTVTQGLKSMQALQARTADAHQKFLETQAEAGRALQYMMESTRRLAEASLGLADDPVTQPITAAAMPERTPAPTGTPSVPDAFAVPQPEVKQAARETRVPDLQSPKTSPSTKPENNSAPDFHGEALSSTLLGVVSELTGYPVEMLNMDMDIEADLGIDSIKRVEILSTLEEKLPGLPSVEPDTMARLKTLGQIAEYLTGSIQPGPAPDAQEGDPSLSPDAMDPANTDDSRLTATILEVVSELTGYPSDMLEMDMDIEADLGIDSIKRVEILSALEERMPGLPAVTPDQMGSLKTLGQIAEFLMGGSGDTSERPSVESGLSPLPLEPAQVEMPINSGSIARTAMDMDIPHQGLDRKTAVIQETPRTKGTPLSFGANRQIYMLEEGSGLAKMIAGVFRQRGLETVLLTRDKALEMLQHEPSLPHAAGLVIVADDSLKNDQEKDRFLKIAFQLSRAAAWAFNRVGEGKSSLFATITRLDGAFGFKQGVINNPVMGGLGGLLKTAAMEWDNVTCRSLDIDPDWHDGLQIAESVAKELLEPVRSEPVEIGLCAKHRYTLTLTALPPVHDRRPQIELGSEDVVVVTGGARGVTAATAIALARLCRSTMVLMGRSPSPSPDPIWLQGITDAAQIKKAILANEFNNNGASPKDIELSYARHTANREINATLQQMGEMGAKATYVSIDIREPGQIDDALEEIRSTFGPISALIHGAGVIEDRLIVDKTPEQFDKVYDTKVVGLRNLLSLTRSDPLRHLVLFSSITARIGNTGQADYAVANEVLNKMAREFSHERRDCRTLSINWGPWDGGMVTPALKRAFQKQNIGLIPLAAGAQSMLAEMGSPEDNPIEIVLGSTMPGQTDSYGASATPAAPLKKTTSTPMSLSFKREIDTIDYPILADHVIGGKPVVPFALITEWFGHGALHENPGLVLHGIDDMRILKGVKLDAEKKLIRLFAGKPSRNGAHYEVSVELRDGVMEGADVVHSRGRAILSDAMPEPPQVDAISLGEESEYHRSVQDIYEDILFHGLELRGIKEILARSSKGMIARIASAPSPARWIKEPLRSGWIADPLALDSAFQMASVWCYEETGNVSLPSYCASYRQYCSVFPADGLTASLEVTALTEHKMTGNFTLVDKTDRLAAKMTGYEAVLDASLYKAFKPHRS